jgi:hypothetical protein
VGFYGGINYGFGYFGSGFWGGRWQGGHFFYNREVANINVVNIRNVYNEHVTIVNNSRVAFNGGNGGIQARPTAQEEQWANERHVGPVTAQTQHVNEARANSQLRASVNRGKPPIAATDRPGNFKSNVIAARAAGGEYRPEEHEAHPGAGGASAPPAVHPRDLPAARMEKPNTGNPKLDQKYQKQQDKLQAKQEKERQNLQRQQDREHQQLARQNASAEKQQQLEPKHQQQTQAMAQRHQQQRQQLSARQAPREEKR